MSFVSAAPDLIAAAASNVAGIESSLKAANSAAAAPTTAVIAAAQDEVSAAIASVLSQHGSAYQALSAQAAEFHSQFVSLLNRGAGAYLRTEAANASTLPDKLSSLTNAAASGPAAAGVATLGPGGYGPGVYADGRVHVEPGGNLSIAGQNGGQTGSLTVAPGSEVWVFPSADRAGSINIYSGMNVGAHSLVLVFGGKLVVSQPFTVGPDVFLSLRPDSLFQVQTPTTIDHSEVEVTHHTLFRTHGALPVTISEGKLNAYSSQITETDMTPPSPSGLWPPKPLIERPTVSRQLVIIRPFM